MIPLWYLQTFLRDVEPTGLSSFVSTAKEKRSRFYIFPEAVTNRCSVCIIPLSLFHNLYILINLFSY